MNNLESENTESTVARPENVTPDPSQDVSQFISDSETELSNPTARTTTLNTTEVAVRPKSRSRKLVAKSASAPASSNTDTDEEQGFSDGQRRRKQRPTHVRYEVVIEKTRKVIEECERRRATLTRTTRSGRKSEPSARIRQELETLQKTIEEQKLIQAEAERNLAAFQSRLNTVEQTNTALSDFQALTQSRLEATTAALNESEQQKQAIINQASNVIASTQFEAQQKIDSYNWTKEQAIAEANRIFQEHNILKAQHEELKHNYLTVFNELNKATPEIENLKHQISDLLLTKTTLTQLNSINNNEFADLLQESNKIKKELETVR